MPPTTNVGKCPAGKLQKNASREIMKGRQEIHTPHFAMRVFFKDLAKYCLAKNVRSRACHLPSCIPVYRHKIQEIEQGMPKDTFAPGKPYTRTQYIIVQRAPAHRRWQRGRR